MRRWLLLLSTPLLVGAADPLAVAEQEARAAAQEQQRLEQAAQAAEGTAAKASAATAAAGQAMLAAEARLAASEVAIGELQRRRNALEARLAEARQPTAALLAGLAQLGRRPQWLALTRSGSAEEQVRLAVLVRAIRPEIERRSAGLRGEWQGLQRLVDQQQGLRQQLASQRQAAAEARSRFAALEKQSLALASARGQEAVGAEDVVLERSERLSLLRIDSVQRSAAVRLASELAALPVAPPSPENSRDNASGAPPFAWTIPASGRVQIGVGELLANGVRSRGLTLSSSRGTQVIAPAAGRVAYAGPFRRRDGVVIIDHGGGWMTLLSEVRPSVRGGDRVQARQAIGRALGPVTAELFRDGTAAPAALIARSS